MPNEELMQRIEDELMPKVWDIVNPQITEFVKEAITEAWEQGYHKWTDEGYYSRSKGDVYLVDDLESKLTKLKTPEDCLLVRSGTSLPTDLVGEGNEYPTVLEDLNEMIFDSLFDNLRNILEEDGVLDIDDEFGAIWDEIWCSPHLYGIDTMAKPSDYIHCEENELFSQLRSKYEKEFEELQASAE